MVVLWEFVWCMYVWNLSWNLWHSLSLQLDCEDSEILAALASHQLVKRVTPQRKVTRTLSYGESDSESLCLYVHVSMCVHVRAYMHVSMCVHVRVCMCVRACMCWVHVYPCMCVYVFKHNITHSECLKCSCPHVTCRLWAVVCSLCQSLVCSVSLT